MKWNFLYQITAAPRTPDYGATAPRSPFSLSSTEFVETPPKKIPGYATVHADPNHLRSSQEVILIISMNNYTVGLLHL